VANQSQSLQQRRLASWRQSWTGRQRTWSPLSTSVVNCLINCFRLIARALAWAGVLAIIYLSVVPAVDRPVTGAGQWTEHFAAFALVAACFAIGYRLSSLRLITLAVFFCVGVELLQVPLPTRHARVSDLVIDVIGSCFGIGCVLIGERFLNNCQSSHGD
jgi:VanZ family protein